MRILLLAPHPCFQLRGTPIAERALLETLCPRGFQFDLLTFHEGEDVRIRGCEHLRIPAPPGIRGIRPGFSWKKVVCDILLALQAFRLASSRHYDLVHAVEESVFIALILRYLFGIPYVYDMDCSLPEQLSNRYRWLRFVGGGLRWLERLAIRRSLSVLAVCGAVERHVLRLEPATWACRVEDASLIDGASAPADNLAALTGPDAKILLYVGNLERYQGIDLLLEAVARARPHLPDTRLVVIGGTPHGVARYRARANELGIGSVTHLLGPRPLETLPGLLAQADVLVSPRLDGLNTPLKIYSYLDAGKAVLATRVPAHTQILDDSIALLVEPTVDQMAGGLRHLMADPAVRRSLGRAARARARQSFSRTAFERKLTRYYSELAKVLGVAGSATDRARLLQSIPESTHA